MRRKTLSILALAAIPSIALAAGGHEKEDARIGRPGDPAKVDRTVEVLMEDSMRYVPDRISVKRGETIRFLVRNAGKLKHEMVLGTLAELKEHEELMRKMPNMQHVERNMIGLKPGQRGSIVWRFTEPGEIRFACLQPGHMEAGMVGFVEVQK